ncbi:2351_t:CDS:10 [Ambispora gerdemannii]|uniref:Exocyst complex component SEC5 n=1 Tax=Ambispora gerdemannii TaxID=144530 RepID=A0A9N9CMX7_9GLOM|nr:2351_t:CDS:10 [Ambispora gerdemannii]
MYRQATAYEQLSEEATILKQYQLDVLDPVEWVDEPDVRKSARYSVGDNAFFQGNGGMENGRADERWSLDDNDPLGIKRSVFTDYAKNNNSLDPYESLKERTQFLVGTKSFNPKLFLRKVHQDTSFNELLTGANQLRNTLDQKSEALKNLVQDNFDRFVSAKNTIDTVYNEMKSKSLNEENEYGVRGLDTALTEAAAKADQVFGPVLENRMKAEKIRSTLTVLEKFKFFFSLPSSLMESLKQQKYDIVIRDYKKGKKALESILASSDTSLDNNIQTPSNGSPEKENDDSALAAQYRKVFDKIWAEVEKIMEEMREQLFKQLTEPWRSMEEQEKTINILLELETVEDPVWHYLDSQYKYIIDLLKESYKEQIDKIEALKQSLNRTINANEVALHLKRAIKIVNSRDFDALSASKDMDVQIWKAILNIVKSLSDLLLRCLPDFWKLSKSFIEGKFQKSPTILSTNRRRRQAMDLRKVEQCQNMAKGVIDLYASLLFEFFTLTSPHEDTSSNTPGVPAPNNDSPSFIPPHSDSVTTCYFLTRIVMEMSDCVNDINSINMSSEASRALSTLMDKSRWGFVEIICNVWKEDAKKFYMLEDWNLDSDNREITTFLRNFHTFHKYNSRCAFKIASLGFVSDDDNKNTSSISDEYLHKIKGAFLDSLYIYLEGLVHLAFSEYSPLEPVDTEKFEFISRAKIDPNRMDSRILLTISNLANLKALSIPRIVSQFENAYQCSMSEDIKQLNDLVDQLDKILFDDYIKRKAATVLDIVEKGILYGNIDWYNISKPTEVHSFVYEALLSLVLVHAEVGDIAKHLVNRTLSCLLEGMAKDCLNAFKKVEKFGMGGMLQATLEIEFMHQTLSQYVTPKAQETLQAIYVTIEQSYDPSQGSGNLQSELNSVKKLLVESRKSTSLQFLCFKKPK